MRRNGEQNVLLLGRQALPDAFEIVAFLLKILRNRLFNVLRADHRAGQRGLVFAVLAGLRQHAADLPRHVRMSAGFVVNAGQRLFAVRQAHLRPKPLNHLVAAAFGQRRQEDFLVIMKAGIALAALRVNPRNFRARRNNHGHEKAVLLRNAANHAHKLMESGKARLIFQQIRHEMIGLIEQQRDFHVVAVRFQRFPQPHKLLNELRAAAGRPLKGRQLDFRVFERGVFRAFIENRMVQIRAIARRVLQINIRHNLLRQPFAQLPNKRRFPDFARAEQADMLQMAHGIEQPGDHLVAAKAFERIFDRADGLIRILLGQRGVEHIFHHLRADAVPARFFHQLQAHQPQRDVFLPRKLADALARAVMRHFINNHADDFGARHAAMRHHVRVHGLRHRVVQRDFRHDRDRNFAVRQRRGADQHDCRRHVGDLAVALREKAFDLLFHQQRRRRPHGGGFRHHVARFDDGLRVGVV